MITHYYLFYDDGVEALLDRFDTKYLLHDVSDNIDHENDIILMHVLYRLSCNTDLYRKKEVFQYAWKMISPRCSENTEFPNNIRLSNYKSGLERLLEYCWYQEFSLHRDGKGAVPICKLIYRKRPIKHKLIDNNILLVGAVLMLFVLAYYIDKWVIEGNSYLWGFETVDTHPILMAVIFMWMSIIAGGVGSPTYKRLAVIPAIMCLFFVISALVKAFGDIANLTGSEWTDYELNIHEQGLLRLYFVKRNILIGLSCLLLCPIVAVNAERLDDLYGRKRTY